MMGKRLLFSLVVLMLLNVAPTRRHRQTSGHHFMRFKEPNVRSRIPGLYATVKFRKTGSYSQVWRTGANKTTELTVTHNMQIRAISKGRHLLYIYNSREGRVDCNNQHRVSLWGSYNYNPNLDLLRLVVPVTINREINEQFTMRFEQRNELADL
jgi:hypothetical protein